MATINRELAEQLIEKLQKQTRPKTYCILRYQNVMFDKEDYAYCNNEMQYQAVLSSPTVGEVKTLWASNRFRQTHGELTASD